MILPERVLGRSSVNRIVFGLAIGPMAVATWSRSSRARASFGSLPAAQDDERADGLAGRLVVAADDRGLGHRGVLDERRLDLGRRDAVAGDVHDVVDAAEQPEVAVVVALGAVAGEVPAGEARPVRLRVALGVAPDAAQHRRPRPGRARGSRRRGSAPARRRRRRSRRRCRGAGTSRCRASAVVAPGSGLIMIAPVSVCHHVSTTGQRPPPMCCQYQIHASGLIGSPTDPSRRSDERSCASGYCVAPLHERADRGRRGVEDRDAVPLDDRPEPVLVRVVRRALVHDARRAVRERAVDDVGVAGDPADVGRAPVDVGVGVQVEDVLVR